MLLPAQGPALATISKRTDEQSPEAKVSLLASLPLALVPVHQPLNHLAFGSASNLAAAGSLYDWAKHETLCNQFAGRCNIRLGV